MRRRYRYDADLDAIVEIGSNYFEESPSGPTVIGDELPGGIHGMRSHADGKTYDSKSRYLADVRARGFEVTGNEKTFPVKQQAGRTDYEREAVKARDQIAGDWNGTRGWLEQMNARTDWRRRNG